MSNWVDISTDFLHQDPVSNFRDADEMVASWLVRRLIGRNDSGGMIICATLPMAERLYNELILLEKLLPGMPAIAVLPDSRVPGRPLNAQIEAERAKVLDRFMHKEIGWLVTGVESALAPALAPNELESCEMVLTPGREYRFQELLERLIEFDYDDEFEVQVPGEFSRRGGLIDIYSPACDFPVRLEFWGDQLETIRRFDPDTQRTTGLEDSYRLIARRSEARETALADALAYLATTGGRLLEVFSGEIEHQLSKYAVDTAAQHYREVRQELDQAGNCRCIYSSADAGAGEEPGIYPAVAHIIDALPVEAAAGNELLRDQLAAQLRQWLDSGYEVTLFAQDEAAAPHLQNWCDHYEIDYQRLTIASGLLPAGVILPRRKLVLLTERELFGAIRRNRTLADTPLAVPAPDTEMSETLVLADLDEGDYAVHLNHGIGIFRGIKNIETNGVRREVMELEYADDARMLVPLIQAGMVSRYLGAAGKVPLSRLGSAKWARDKFGALRAVREYAGDLLRMQAVRQAGPGLPLSPAGLEERAFANSFEFTMTMDQQKSIDDIFGDLAGGRPMDRLLCGDVGYGKTEVAMQAAFRLVNAGYQVAVLAPTTVLAQQHFYSFRERFAEYPFVIEMLSRFRTHAEQHRLLERARSGGIDILIGTHRLCQEDVDFSNLGLVIVDEEQRFGVKHKERIRRFRSEVNVLTMSATPIPRTLYMAMAGARDLSTILTAPSLRTPVETVVTHENDTAVYAAIRQELARGGQVFYLHNRVKTIRATHDRLRALFPDVRFAIAHGQMDEDELEVVMAEFIQGSIDVLVCTTIIESGLDVPNANTIIIERADRFGLAELYQLRGRVGRWKHQAYAWLLVPRSELMTDDGRKRIAAIRRYTHLGAGFRLALRDLEIRGAGNLLGQEQSGHLKAIGFELYCHLLKQEVARMQGKNPEFLPEVDMNIDFVQFAHKVPEGILAAAIPPEYIPSERLRVAAYRQLSMLTGYEALEAFTEELQDRYGRIPAAVTNLLQVTRVRIAAARAGYVTVTVEAGRLSMFNAAGHVYRRNGRLPILNQKNPPHWQLNELFEVINLA